MLTTSTEPLAEHGWPSAKEAMEWLEVLEPDLSAGARRRETDWHLALWVRLVAMGAARELQQDEVVRVSGVM
jgi:hypothetical protein